MGEGLIMVTFLILSQMDIDILNYGKIYLVKVLHVFQNQSSTKIGSPTLGLNETVVVDHLFKLSTSMERVIRESSNPIQMFDMVVGRVVTR